MTLAEFLETPEGRVQSKADWARTIEVTRGYFCQLANGSRLPSLKTAADVHRVTKGKVTVTDWGV